MPKVFGVKKGVVFTKNLSFTELVSRYESIFLIIPSPKMNTDGLVFWGIIEFEDTAVLLEKM